MATAGVGVEGTVQDGRPVAPWWHTVVVLLPLMLGSYGSWHRRTLSGVHLRGLPPKLSSYLFVLCEEWFLVLLIWLAARQRGVRLADLMGRSWPGVGAFFRDFGLAVAFLVITMPIVGILVRVTAGDLSKSMSQITPQTVPEMCMWVLMSVTAGFCEELIFRGYLMRQFSAWTHSVIAGLVLQAAMFGLAHGYYHAGVIAIFIDGLFYGAFALWRKSLRPGMMAHGLQDLTGGLVSFLSHHAG